MSTMKLFKFYAGYCGACKTIDPILREVAEELKIEYFTVNIENSPEMGEDFKIQRLPTVVLFENGVEIRRFTGSKSKAEISEWIKSAL